MKILGIETSCDETAVAIVEDGVKIHSNIVASSANLHAKTGGIIPEMAARQQVTSIIPVLEEAMNDIDKDDIDAIAVTVGPGLVGSLLVGIETARTLAYLWKKPIIPVNHLVAHIYANWVSGNNKPEFPLLALVVSGGHTDLAYMEGHQNMKWIGGTRDDAAGEAFDKTARLLGLPYPGGPAISKEAEKVDGNWNLFPRPMIHENNYEWSFSGLKTAVLREVQKLDEAQIEEQKGRLAAEVQEAIVDSLVSKAVKAIKEFAPKSFLLAGGVAANKRLTEKFKSQIMKDKLEVEFFVPDVALCTDNGVAIASCAYFNNTQVTWQDIQANPELSITSKE